MLKLPEILFPHMILLSMYTNYRPFLFICSYYIDELASACYFLFSSCSFANEIF